jgi:hypothetical protein
LPTTTLNVQRSAAYAGLDVNVVSAQYAEYFSNDNIRPGQGIIRLNMKIFNRGSDHIKIVYYNSVRLIAQGVDPIVPTNLALSAGPDPGKSENGWIDFSVAKQIPLDKLMLQLGDSRIHESLVKIPFKGDFDASRYADRSVKQDLAVNYVFVRKFIPYALNYHLNNVEVRYAFQGVQCKEGQQFYIFDFTVSNPGGGDIIPGSAYNYLRLVINGYNQFPIASTLTDTIHGNAQGVKGQVVFSGPTDMHTLDLIFLKQYGSEQYSYWVNA